MDIDRITRNQNQDFFFVCGGRAGDGEAKPGYRTRIGLSGETD